MKYMSLQDSPDSLSASPLAPENLTEQELELTHFVLGIPRL